MHTVKHIIIIPYFTLFGIFYYQIFLSSANLDFYSWVIRQQSILIPIKS